MFEYWHRFLYDSSVFIGTVLCLIVIIGFTVAMIEVYKVDGGKRK